MLGDIQPDQDVTSCIGCGAMMHTECVKEFGLTLPGQHVRFARQDIREKIDSQNLSSARLAVCEECYNGLISDALRNLEASGNFEAAAQFLEGLGRWEEAGAMRKRARTQTVRTVRVDLNALLDRIRAGGLVVDYKCPSCGAPLRVDKAVKDVGLTSCPYCHATLDTGTVARLIGQALGD
jgi:rubrerythrin